MPHPNFSRKKKLPATVNKSALSPPHWGHGSSHLSAQKKTATRDVECGWTKFPWSFVLKEGEGNDGEFAGMDGSVHGLQEVSEYTVILVP